MRKTILSHFFNEEYLLPWWLEHHKKYFDHGILIDYNSTDNSVSIAKEICPGWEVIPSRNKFFGAEIIDIEVMDIESKVEGWKVCLNTTEFLVGDYTLLDDSKNSEYIVPCHVMVDNNSSNLPTYDRPLVEQKPYGISYINHSTRRPRKIHNKEKENYPLGRHYDYSTYNSDIFTDKLAVLWYGWSPYNEFTKRRKLQIQTRIPESDKARRFGAEHLITQDALERTFQQEFLPKAALLSAEYKKLGLKYDTN